MTGGPAGIGGQSEEARKNWEQNGIREEGAGRIISRGSWGSCRGTGSPDGHRRRLKRGQLHWSPRLKMTGEGFAGSPGLLGVVDWDKPMPTVTGRPSVTSSTGPAAVADIRLKYCPRGADILGVQKWKEVGKAVIGNARTNGSNAAAVADPRLKETTHPRFTNKWQVLNWERPSSTVSRGSRHTGGGILCRRHNVWGRSTWFA